jgi:hypothetical protein
MSDIQVTQWHGLSSKGLGQPRPYSLAGCHQCGFSGAACNFPWQTVCVPGLQLFGVSIASLTSLSQLHTRNPVLLCIAWPPRLSFEIWMEAFRLLAFCLPAKSASRGQCHGLLPAHIVAGAPWITAAAALSAWVVEYKEMSPWETAS